VRDRPYRQRDICVHLSYSQELELRILLPNRLVVGPDLLRVEGCEPHFLGAGTLLALRESLGDQRPFAPAFDRLAFGWCIRQAQRELLLQDQREGRADVLARRVTRVAAPFEAVARRRTQGKRYGGGVNGEAKPILIEFDLGGDVDVVLAARGNEVIALRTQELRGPNESEARKRVEQRGIARRSPNKGPVGRRPGRDEPTRQDLAKLAGVHRTTVTETPGNARLQGFLREALRALSAAYEVTRDRDRSIFWFRNTPIPEFGHRTAETIVAEGKTDAVIAYLTSVAAGSSG
jgi:hypothetical protein